MSSACNIVLTNAAKLWSCKETENGARIRTTCIFPSFEPVFVYVIKFGDGFIVHDAGETMGVILSHGQEADVAKRFIRSECKRYDLSLEDRRISLKIDALEWLETAIVSVANTASTAARLAIAEVSKKADIDLADVLFDLLEPKLSKGTLAKDFPFQGASGRRYKFDLAIQERDKLTLIQAVRPNAISVNSKYVALSDIPMDDPIQKIAAHNNNLSIEDILLLQNVATVSGPSGVVNLLSDEKTIH